MGAGAAAAIQLLLGLIDRAAAISTVIGTAQAQGRDVTTAELDNLRAQDDAARAKLEQAIKEAQARGQR